jgi:hypothetical protein
MTEYINPRMRRVRVRGGRHIHAVHHPEGIARTLCGSRRLRAVDREAAGERVTCPGCLKIEKGRGR